MNWSSVWRALGVKAGWGHTILHAGLLVFNNLGHPERFMCGLLFVVCLFVSDLP